MSERVNDPTFYSSDPNGFSFGEHMYLKSSEGYTAPEPTQGGFTPPPINHADQEARKNGEWEPGYFK